MQLLSQIKPIIGTLPYLFNSQTVVNPTKHTNTKLSFTEFSTFTEHKSYVPISGCVLEHTITTGDLSSLAKLYNLLTNSLAFINAKTNKERSRQRSCSLSSKTWARLLNCSRSQVFALQRSLRAKGYLLITKDKNKYGQNKRNLLIPTLPDSVFKSLCKAPDKIGKEHLVYGDSRESKLEYLDRTKLFIPLNYDLLKIITANEDLSPLQKVIWLDFYAKCYKCHTSSNKTFGFSFITSYDELMDRYRCSRASLSKAMTILENNNFMTKTRFFRKKDHAIEDRQDKSLWQITLSVPASYNLELINIKDRDSISTAPNYLEKSNNDINILPISQVDYQVSQKTTSVKHQLCSDKIAFKENLANYCNNKTDDDYIDNVIEELATSTTDTNVNIDVNSLVNTDGTVIVSNNDVDKIPDLSALQHDISCTDPHISKSSLYINKDLILKIKDIKSNLGPKPKVLFNEFLKRFKRSNCVENESIQTKEKEFNIYSELIRKKLKELPKDKADKARKFAYSLISKGLANGYAASLGKHELAKQIIHHAATWKPTKFGSISKEKEIDTALSVAWKKIVGGTWQIPLELAKAEILQHEFNAYRRKYQESGVLSHEAKALESDVNNLLGGWCDLVGKITKGVNLPTVIDENACSIRDVDTSISINIPLELGLEERDYRQSSCPPHGRGALDGSFISDLVNDKGSHQLDYDYPKIEECSNRLNISLSHIPEQQKYLRITPSDNDDSMKLENMGGKEYFVKLKELEMNDQGEFVMTLKTDNGDAFHGQIAALSYGNLLLSSSKNLVCTDNNNQQRQQSTREFVKIDTALSISSIFKNLQHKVE